MGIRLTNAYISMHTYIHNEYWIGSFQIDYLLKKYSKILTHK